jgi:hypothetical protein
MIRNLKVLGLAAAAVLAMSVVATTVAQATEFTASAGVYPVTIESSMVTPGIFTVEGGRQVTCETTLFDVAPIFGPSEQETATPTVSNCHAKILGNKLDATVTFNKCSFLGTTSGLVHFECPAGEDAEVHIYNGSGVKHEAATQICKYTIKPQTINSLDYTNQGSGTTADILVTATMKEIKVEKTLGTKVNCGQEVQNTATFTGSGTVKGRNAGGTQIGIHVL